LKIAHDLILMASLRILFEIKTIAYDVIGVNLFLPKLMKFLPKKGDNSVPPILLNGVEQSIMRNLEKNQHPSII
ncbi:MAG: hypothetical protein MI923_11115, partial [Phycisphaerales bacterium]|nr:hypothetical protein [Phycisphaerales bacterium]